MANEFVARKGIIALSGGAQITGSLLISGAIDATGYDVIARSFTGSFSGSIGTATFAETANTASYIYPTGLPTGLVSSSGQVSYTGLSNIPNGIVSNSIQIDVRNTTGIATIATTGSNTFTGTQTIAGNIFLNTTNPIVYNNSANNSLLFGFYDGSSIYGPYFQIFGNNYANAAQRGGAEFVYDTRNGGDGNFHVSSYDGSTWIQRFRVDDVGTQVTGSLEATSGITGSFKGDGSQLTGIAATLAFSGSTTGTDSLNLKTEALIFSGSNGITATVTNNTVTFAAPAGTVTASSQIDHDLTTNFLANEHIDHSAVSISAGSGLTGGGDITATRTISLDTASATFLDGIKAKLNTETVVSSSTQIKTVLNTENIHSASYLGTATTTNLPEGTNLYYLDSRVKDKLNLDGIFSSSAQVNANGITGTGPFAVTSSNTFTGIQTISNTTNSTVFNDGALIVAGGVGIAKDVNISGSLTVTGLLTAISTSVQYVTSSQLNVADNKIIVNTNDILRFGGLSVVDSGSSSPTTASIYWDSLAHHFVYENLSGSAYNSAIIIAGPKNTGALGNEAELIAGRVPVASGGDHIDTAFASSSIRVDFPSLLTHIEAGLYVTGAITSSVGFSGDGSQLTGIVTNLNITGSESGTGTVSLKTQGLIVSGTNGLIATVSGQTLTLSGSNATTSTKGVASFNSTNFTVTGGEVTSNNITINGTAVTLGGTRNITLAQITTHGASTADAVTLSGGVTIGNSFQTSSTYTATGPTTNEVVVSLPTGSFDAIHFDYIIKSGSNLRTGTIMAVWTGASVEFTDTSTNDIGNTRNAEFTVDTNSGNVRLKFSVTSGTWTIKTLSKLI